MTSAREHKQLSYAELVEELQALVREVRSGIMFIRTESGHLVRIGLEKGRIVSCIDSVHKGQAAIALIRRIRSGKYSFMPGIPSVVAGEALPGNFDFFKELAGVPNHGTFPAPASTPITGQTAVAGGAPSAAPAARAESSPGATDLRVSSDELFETVVRELTMYLGPIARLVAAEYEERLRSARSGEQVRALGFQLAQEIGDARHAAEFEARILSLVSSWGGP